jgi:hypothetical protein
MKRFALLFIAFLGMAMAVPQQAHAQNDAISKYFDKYMDDESFTVVYISSKMFKMFSKVDPDMDEEVKDVIKDLRGLRILMKESDGKKYYKEAVKMIDFNEYEELMTVRTEDENVKFVVKEANDIIEELLLIVGGDDEFVLLSFVGKIDLAKISKLTDGIDIDIDGIDNLKELDKDKDDDKKEEKKDDNDDDE